MNTTSINLEQLFQNLFYIFLILKTMTQLILGVKNRRYLKSQYHQVPNEVSDKFTLEQHQKSIDYYFAKSKLGKFKTQFEAVFLLALLPLGGVNLLNNFISSISHNYLHQGVLFFLALSVISLIINIPFSLYSNFVIEEKFGFNKMTYKTFFSDLIKQMIIGAILLTPILYCLLWLFNNLGETWWLYAWGAITAFQFFIVWLYPSVIAPLFNKFTPLNTQDLKEEIQRLSLVAGFEAKAIEVMDASRRSSHGNAYFTGLGKKKKIVFFDTLIEKLSMREISAVLAHEMGHYAKKHIIKMLVTSLLSSLLGFAILGYLSNIPAFYSGHFINEPSAHMALFIFMNVLPLYTFFISPLGSIFSRKHEYEADDFAAEHTNSDDLISALIKLHQDNSAILIVDRAYAFFYYSHPPLIQRIKNLKKETF